METKKVMAIIDRLYEVGAISDFNWERYEIEKEVASIVAAQPRKAPDPFDASFDKQYELAKQIGDRRFGSECKHIHVTDGVCLDCLRRVI
jgi:hypothetical protein